MCGIVGIVDRNSPEISDILIKKALSQIDYRGPDHRGVKKLDGIALGHTRLSIIDPSSQGHQPFEDETGNYFLLYNGEVFNFHELKKDLIAKGVKFKTQTDTEVVLYHLIDKGKEGLKDFNGFFALALYDKKNQNLLLARDRSGIKPLYYRIKDGCFRFSSDVRGVMVGTENKLDKEKIAQYLRFTYTPSNITVVKDIVKMTPGHSLTLNAQGEIKDKSFGKIPPSKNPNIDFKTMMENAVINRLVADVPLGSFLSGGIDSSIVSSIAQKHLKELHTYSVGFKNASIDESSYAEDVAQHIGSSHHKVWIEEKDFKENLDDILNSFDEPFADASSVAMYFLCKKASKHLRVALSGDGADELLGGYRKHQAFLKSQKQSYLFNALQPIYFFTKEKNESRTGKWGNMMRKVNRFMKLKDLSPAEKYWELAAFHDKSNVNQLMGKEFDLTPYEISNQELNKDFNHFLWNDQINVLPNDMLKKVDLMSLKNNMEVRPVFLDDHIIEYCNQLPSEKKINLKQGKLLLRETYKNDLPQHVFKRKKQGFEIPLESWIYQLIDEIESRNYFSKSYLDQQQIFDPAPVQNLIKSIKKGNKKHASLVWCLLVFQHWYDQHFNN